MLSKSRHARHWPPAIALAALGAVVLVWLEMVKAMQSEYWAGVNFGEALGLGAAGLGYFAVLLVISRLFWPLLPASWGESGRGATTFIASTGLLWVGLRVLGAEAAPWVDGAVVGGLGALAVAVAVTARHASGGATTGALALSVAVLSGCFAHLVVGEWAFLSEHRALIFLVASAVGLGVIVGALCWAFASNKNPFAVLIALLVLAIAPIAWALSPMLHYGGERKGPNLVVITIDTLRSDYCSVYGGPVATPHLEELAAEGVLFERHYALAPWTMPSICGLFSSEHPAGFDGSGDHDRWAAEMGATYWYTGDRRTPSEAFAEKGYVNGAFVANHFLHQEDGLLRGTDVSAAVNHLTRHYHGPLAQTPFLRSVIARVSPSLVEPGFLDTTRIVTRYGQSFLRRHRDRSFYLWLHTMNVHDPYDPPQAYRDAAGPWPHFSPVTKDDGSPHIPNHADDLAESDREYARSLYEAEIRYMDAMLGVVLDELDALGLRDSTYICVTADHGEELWDHGQWGHAHTLYEEQLRVPLIIAGPGVQADTRAEPVSAIDVWPTLAELAGLALDDDWEGASMAAVLEGDTEEWTPSPVFANGTWNDPPNPLETVIRGRMKLVREMISGETALYDLETDPAETSDISAGHPTVAATLRQELEAWSSALHQRTNDEDASRSSDAEFEERLRSLGYLD